MDDFENLTLKTSCVAVGNKTLPVYRKPGKISDTVNKKGIRRESIYTDMSYFCLTFLNPFLVISVILYYYKSWHTHRDTSSQYG